MPWHHISGGNARPQPDDYGASRQCPHCGEEVDSDYFDSFHECPACGGPLAPSRRFAHHSDLEVG